MMSKKYLQFFIIALGVLAPFADSSAQERRNCTVYLEDDSLGPKVPLLTIAEGVREFESRKLVQDKLTFREAAEIVNKTFLENAKAYTRAFREPETFQNMMSITEKNPFQYTREPRRSVFLIGTDGVLTRVHLVTCRMVFHENSGSYSLGKTGVTIPTDVQLESITPENVNSMPVVLSYTNHSSSLIEWPFFSFSKYDELYPPHNGEL